MIIIDYDNYPVASEMLQIFSYCDNSAYNSSERSVFLCHGLWIEALLVMQDTINKVLMCLYSLLPLTLFVQ